MRTTRRGYSEYAASPQKTTETFPLGSQFPEWYFPGSVSDHFPYLSVVDIGALIVILIGVIQGIRRGLSGELARLVGAVLALALGLFCLQPFGAFVENHTRLSERSARLLAFILVVVAVVGAMILLRWILRNIMKVTFEEKIEKIGGCIAGILRMTVFVFIVFVIMNMCPGEYLNRKFGEESLTGKGVLKCLPPLKEKIEQIKESPATEKVKETIEEKK